MMRQGVVRVAGHEENFGLVTATLNPFVEVFPAHLRHNHISDDEIDWLLEILANLEPFASIRRGQLTFVFTVDTENRARLRAVSPGITDGDRLEVLAGLRANDIVITNPPPSLTDGAATTGLRR